MKYIALLVLGFVTVLAQDPPPFLAGAPAEDVQKFYDLLKNDESKTDPQIDADIEAFVTSLGGDYKVELFIKKKKNFKYTAFSVYCVQAQIIMHYSAVLFYKKNI